MPESLGRIDRFGLDGWAGSRKIWPVRPTQFDLFFAAVQGWPATNSVRGSTPERVNQYKPISNINIKYMKLKLKSYDKK